MKSIHLIFIFGFLLLSCGKTSSQKENDQAKIKTQYMYSFNYELKEGKHQPDYTDTIEFKGWQYNEKDELTRFIMRTKQHWDTTFYSYEYDKQGRLIDKINHNPPIKPYHEKYTYNEKGNKVKEEHIGHADTAYLTYNYIYNEKNQPIVKLSTRSIDSSWFDDKGNEIQLKMYEELFAGMHRLNLEFRYEYDEKGNKTVNDSYSNGYRYSHVIIKYDDKNSVTEVLTYHLQNNLKDSLVEHLVYKHTYDDHNNPVEIICLDGKTQIPLMIYLYKYEYY